MIILLNKLKKREYGFTLVECLVVLAIFALMVAFLMPFVRMTRERANRITCANNLRKISLGLHYYAADHNDSFPPDLAALYPNYVDDEKAFDCPSSPTRGTAAKPDYNYEPGLTERSPLKTVIASDIYNNHKGPGRNILRVNGSVEWVNKGDQALK